MTKRWRTIAGLSALSLTLSQCWSWHLVRQGGQCGNTDMHWRVSFPTWPQRPQSFSILLCSQIGRKPASTVTYVLFGATVFTYAYPTTD